MCQGSCTCMIALHIYIHHDSGWMFSLDVSVRLHLFVTCLHCDYVIIECSLQMYQSGCVCPCYLFLLWLCHIWMFSVDVSIRVYLSMLPVCTVTMLQLNVLCRCINQGVLVHVTCLYCHCVSLNVLYRCINQGVLAHVTCLYCDYVRISVTMSISLYLMEDCFLLQWSQGVIVTCISTITMSGVYSKR